MPTDRTDLITISDAARELGCHRKVVSELAERHGLVVLTVGPGGQGGKYITRAGLEFIRALLNPGGGPARLAQRMAAAS